MKTKKILYWVLIVFFSVVILVSGFIVARYLINSHRAQQSHDYLQSIRDSGAAATSAPTTVPTTTPTDATQPSTEVTQPTETQPTEPTEPEILPDYKSLYELNNDLVGWIQIADTKIDYPVVQSPYEANYYLYRGFNKEYDVHGSIYAREACDIFKPSDNITLYGHAMADNTMFAMLHYYKFDGYFEEHKYIKFDTLYEHHIYEIIAVFNTTAVYGEGFAYHLFDDARDEAAFNVFINTCKQLSFIDTDTTATYGDKLITLSTCDKNIGSKDGRLVVVAKRIS